MKAKNLTDEVIDQRAAELAKAHHDAQKVRCDARRRRGGSLRWMTPRRWQLSLKGPRFKVEYFTPRTDEMRQIMK